MRIPNDIIRQRHNFYFEEFIGEIRRVKDKKNYNLMTTQQVYEKWRDMKLQRKDISPLDFRRHLVQEPLTGVSRDFYIYLGDIGRIYARMEDNEIENSKFRYRRSACLREKDKKDLIIVSALLISFPLLMTGFYVVFSFGN